MKYDYLVVGAGLFGAAFAQMAKEKGKRVLVIDKRSHIAGNIYTEDVGGIAVHRYGARTSSTPTTRRFGSTPTASPRSTASQTRRWQNTKIACTTCLST